MKLTSTTIKKLSLPHGVADRTFWDDEIGGFGLRLRAGGSARWIVQYDLGGKTKRVTLGTTALVDPGAARARARDLLAQVRLGGDPAADKRRRHAQASETFGALLPRYFIVRQGDCRHSTYKQIERRLTKLARPLHPLPLTSIDRRAISSLLGAIAVNNGPTAATNAHGTLSGYFSWLIGEGLLDDNPMIGANKPKPRPSRERMHTVGELRTLWAALDDDDYGDIIKLLIYTGLRRGEIGGLRWSEIDLDAATADIPGARMKNGLPHLLALSPPVLAILRKRQRDGRDIVFGKGGTGFQGWSWGRRKLDAAIGGERPDWTLHDFRRLVSTVMHDQLGIAPHVVERVIAHVQGGVAGVYNKAEYAVERRRALERWAAWVDEMITGVPATGEVVSLRRAIAGE